MKHMIIATALATTLGTASFAANEAQIQQVEGYSNGIDTSTYTDRDFDIAYGIVTSGMSRGEKTGKLRALATEDNVDLGAVMISEAELTRLQEYAPDVDFSTITQSQAEIALAVTYGEESVSTVTRRVQNILSGSEMDAETLAVVTQGQTNMLSTFISADDIALLTEDDLQLALSFAYSGMSRGQKASQIEGLIAN